LIEALFLQHTLLLFISIILTFFFFKSQGGTINTESDVIFIIEALRVARQCIKVLKKTQAQFDEIVITYEHEFPSLKHNIDQLKKEDISCSLM